MEEDRTAAGIRGHEDPDAEKAAFAAMYHANVTEVFRYVHRRCRDTELAQDITQDVFMSAMNTQRPTAEINTGWLIVAARHRLIDVVRRRDRYATKLVLLQGGHGDPNENGPVDRIVLEEAMDRLSLDYRVVLSLHYLDAMTVAEMADHLARTVKSVEGLLTRARRSLRRELEASDG